MEKSNIGERFAQFVNAVSPTQVDFANRISITPQALQKYLKSGRHPMPDVLIKLNELGCNINWLLTGKGEMITELKLFKPRTKPVSIIGEVQCGIPIQTQMIADDVKQMDMFDVSGYDRPFIVIAKGDSMSPYINHGDLLLCAEDSGKAIKNGKAVVVNYKSEPENYTANAKLIKLNNKKNLDDGIVLYSVNTKYQPSNHNKTEIFKIYPVMRIIREVR